MSDPHRAFRQFQRMLMIDDQGRSYRQPSVIREEDCEVLAVFVVRDGKLTVEAPPDKKDNSDPKSSP
ncbi:MAG: hypothetical protein KBC81_00290 [Candidatus Pacebacteria bacterium]|nr:hypothetical protein [Candidatus Paceibacterota bacterium]